MKIFSIHLACVAIGGLCLAFSFLNALSTRQETVQSKPFSETTRKATAALTQGQSQPMKTKPADPKKLALIVAISHYDPETGWNDLSAQRDALMVKAALATQGFDTVRNVVVLQDQKATRKGMAEIIRSHLIEKALHGSTVVFHYSGHGQQVFDDNGEEIDGYDEALVPYDAPMKASGKQAGYLGEKHMRDDELGALLSEVQEKIGATGTLTVVLDACHSGTATRGIGKARGTLFKIAPKDYSPLQPPRSYQDDWLGAAEGADLAPRVVISGASAHELNYEAQDEQGQWVGPLSYAFSRAFAAADAHTTYQGLFDKIKVDMSAMAPRQSPQIEGAVDRQVLGGNALPKQHHYRVKAWSDARHLSIDAGQLMGLFARSEIALYDIDTSDTTGVAPKATGTIVASYFLESKVVLDRPLAEQEAKNSWAFVKNKNFGAMQVKVGLHIQHHTMFEEALKIAFHQVPLIQLEQAHPELVVEMNNTYTKSRGGNAFQMITANDDILYQNTVAEDQLEVEAEEVTRRVISFAQAKFLRKLTLEEPSIKVRFEVIPIKVEQKGQRIAEVARIPIEEKREANGRLVLTEGDHFKLKIINQGERKAYYCMLDIQPDNIINVMIPSGYRTAEEYFIEAKDTLELKEIFIVGKPYGTESFKLIATRQPIDISPIITHRGLPPTRKLVDRMHPLERLLLESYKSDHMPDRGSSTVSTPPSSGHIETLVLKIVKAD